MFDVSYVEVICHILDLIILHPNPSKSYKQSWKVVLYYIIYTYGLFIDLFSILEPWNFLRHRTSLHNQIGFMTELCAKSQIFHISLCVSVTRYHLCQIAAVVTIVMQWMGCLCLLCFILLYPATFLWLNLCIFVVCPTGPSFESCPLAAGSFSCCWAPSNHRQITIDTEQLAKLFFVFWSMLMYYLNRLVLVASYIYNIYYYVKYIYIYYVIL